MMPARHHSATNDNVTHIYTSNATPERLRKRRKESPEDAPVQQDNSIVKGKQRTANTSEVSRGDESRNIKLPPENTSTKDPELPSIDLVSRPASHASRRISNRDPATPTTLSADKPPRDQGSANSQDSESGTLRLSTQKPRKKLMYSALLPQTGSQSGSQKRQRPLSNLDSSVGLQNTRIGHRSRPTEFDDLSDLIHEFSSDDFPDAIAAPNPANTGSMNESPSDSTLIAFADLIAAEGSPLLRTKASRTPYGSHDLGRLQRPPGPAVKLSLPDSRSATDLETGDASIAPPKPVKQPRQLLRSHTDAGSLRRRVPAQFPSSPPLPPLKEESSNENAEQSNPKGLSTRPLKKSISDLSSLRPQNRKHSHTVVATGKKHPDPIPEENEHEQGPWTNEALDLFDWWPPGKPKPT